MFKIIKEMLPPDVRVARDAQDLLVECCVGKACGYYTVYTIIYTILAYGTTYVLSNARITFSINGSAQWYHPVSYSLT
jgi:hypothetical protein